MADEGSARRNMRKDILTLHAMVAMMGAMLLLLMLALTQLTSSVEYTYFIGFILATVGIALVAGAIYQMSMPYLAVGAALQFVGGALAAIGILKVEDLITVVMVMAMPPLAFGQYQVGACVLTIKNFIESEGVDYGPALTDLREHMLESIRSLALLIMAGFGVSVLLIIFLAFFMDVLALNSLALMGVLIIAIGAGATILLLLKGGKVVVEEVAEGEEPKPKTEEGPAGTAGAP